MGNQERVSVSYPGLIHDLEVGDKILLNNGLLVFEVEALEGTEARCRVLVGGETSNNKSMSFPNKVMSQVYLSEQDKADLLLGLENEVDYIACSFVSRKQDILDVKDIIAQHTDRYIGIIAKIENQAGIDNIEEICQVCDGVMVARGDLGVEVPFEKLPAIQKKLINTCRRLGKRSITATEMLGIHDPQRTAHPGGDQRRGQRRLRRHQRRDALRGDRRGQVPGGGGGDHGPDRGADRAGRELPEALLADGVPHPPTRGRHLHATCAIAIDINAKAIVACSLSGMTVRMVCPGSGPRWTSWG